jgi:Flp pilus assembly protein TadD
MIRRSIIRCAAALALLVIPAFAAARRQPVTPADAFFTHSDLQSVRVAAQSSKAGVSTVFAAMEAAALQLDSVAELDYALRLCERWGNDPRASIAASRILEMAANTASFRAAVPHIRALIAADSPQANTLRAALIAAGDDGLPQIDRAALARESGLLTDWRVAGPFGHFANVAFEKSWPAERDALASSDYDGRAVEELRFANGTFRLPDYFSPEGVLYAAARLTLLAAETRVLRVESPGTLEVQIDGRAVLTKDDRLDATPETVSARLPLSAGPHDVVVKFITSAVPFRIAFVPEPRVDKGPTAFSSETESAYVAAAQKFWAGDYDGALTDFTAIKKTHDSAAVEYMLARTESQLDDSSEAAAALALTLKLAPTADAARHDLAMLDIEQNHAADALSGARKLALGHPHDADAQELFATAAMQANSPDANKAIATEIELHPSCAILNDAAQYFSASGDVDQARRIIGKLDHCAPESLDFATQLANTGDHAQAAHAALQIAQENPTNRQARAFAVKELMLAGDMAGAKRTAQELVRIAPNSAPFAALLAQASHPEADPFVAGKEFYRPYRRDGIMVVRETSERRYSGGPSVTLLHDRVVRFDGDGGAMVYVHRITRVLDRDGIEQEGEVTLPLGAEVLELRTIKPDLSTFEPEFSANKPSVSMPALAAGDAIDAEYVYRVTDLNARPEVLQYDFGSFVAPIVFARFVAISRADHQLRVFSSHDAPQPDTERDGNIVTQIWQANDLAQSVREVSSAPDALPFVRLGQYANWTEVRDQYRDVLIDAVRSGPDVEQAAAILKGDDPEQAVHDLYHYLKTKIRPADTEFSSATLPTAENTLAKLAGSRTVAAIAIARAAGIKADLLLARNVAKAQSLPSTNIFTRPLVLFTFANGDSKLALDFETDGVAFDAQPATVAREALYVPVANEQSSPLASIPQSAAGEESVATGDITIDENGDLAAHIVIRMGASRATQMRGVLAGVEPAQRPHFFEQLAARIFPGASSTQGVVRHEYDTDQPLEIEFSTDSPAFLNVQGRTVDLEQLVPALGLRKMYAVDAPRLLPLYIETPLIERATFRVQLPPDLAVYANASDLNLSNEFGDYAVTFRTLPDGVLEITRAFHLPVQVVAPDHFGAFASFARQIDDAERQRVTLIHTPANTQASNR